MGSDTSSKEGVDIPRSARQWASVAHGATPHAGQLRKMFLGGGSKSEHKDSATEVPEDLEG